MSEAQSSQLLRVLCVEDVEDDAVLLARLLQRSGWTVRWHRVDSAASLAEALRAEAWDVVLCDYRMPGFNAHEALRIVRAHDPDLPFLVVSGTVGEELAVEMMRAGANDYVMKDNLTRLPAAIARELREAEVRRARRQAEAQARLLWQAVEQGSSLVLVMDPERRVTYVNRRWTEVTGIPAEEVLGRPVEEIGLLISLPDELRREIRKAVESGKGWRGEVQVRRKDGSPAWVMLAISALWDETGQTFRFVCVAEDVTPLVEAEERERRLRERLERQVHRLQALRLVDTAITGSFDLRITLNVILDQLTIHLGVEAAAVLLLDPGTASFRAVVARGLRRDLVTQGVRIGEGLVGRVVLGRERLHVPNLSEVPGSREARLVAEGFRAYCALPLTIKGQVLGVLETLSRKDFPDDPEWWEFLEALAGQAAVAIDNGTLLENLQRANLELQRAYDATLEGWSRAMDLRDRETEGHTQRVAELTVALARAMGVAESEIVHIRRGALLHDIGKIGVPDEILRKPGPLTEEEWAIMRLHPVYAYRWLAGIEFLRPALDIPYAHHERWDGTGYPRGLRGEEIPLSARIFAVVDVYDALTSERPYRPAWSREKALQYIREQAGKQFDPAVVEAFLRLMEEEPFTLPEPGAAGPP
ncbi:MAG: HD domain-containing phosphohydrolase [Armatimonadota bacterium]|nr:HD domain-containing phosphohydrolase [Armatimonadota bacterium]MDR7443473.1 HD domain-containing phosphohydrolase [Armatimonadota bacterium]MDR7569311.1 HD domain-containing phosphohydrolase [Armatimonadota bacterium]MDR7614971.1 HD domain-containing phosphohydrolase [Armatimonadota bacterium]